MTLQQLIGKSQRLRRELEALYGEPVWNTRAIDRVSDELTEAQMALARRGVTGRFSDAENSPDQQSNQWFTEHFQR